MRHYSKLISQFSFRQVQETLDECMIPDAYENGEVVGFTSVSATSAGIELTWHDSPCECRTYVIISMPSDACDFLQRHWDMFFDIVYGV